MATQVGSRLVGVLYVLLLGAVHPWGGGQVGRSERLLDVGSCLLDRLLGYPRGIGPHIGNQAFRALVTQRDTLIELLCYLHRPLRGESTGPGGLLLECARDERRRRVPLCALLLDLLHPETRILESLFDL